VILPCADGMFSGVGMMDVRRRVWECCVLRVDELLYILGGFIVHFVQLWFEAPAGQVLVGDLIGVEEFFLSAILDGNRRNKVGIVNVENDKVSVASVGCDGEAAGLVGEHHSSDVVDGHENKIG
jgi:hypothetical protein